MKQTVYYQTEGLSDIKKILKDENIDKILLFSDSPAFTLTGAEEYFSKLESNYEIYNVNNFSPNPKFEELSDILNEIQRIEFDIIIAVGGGSVIDMAKLVKIFSAQDFPADKYFEESIKFADSTKKMIAIPTTFGTGSEATHFAVLYKEKVKHSIADANILPEYVILDPSLTKSIPDYVAACSAMDAFSQAIESFWSVNATEESRKYSSKAIKLLINDIVSAVKEKNIESKQKIQYAAYLAGRAINISKTTAPHAFSYTLTSYYNIPHGHAVGIFLPVIFRFNYENSKNSQGIWNSLKKELLVLLGTNNVDEAVKFIYEIMSSIGLKTKIKDFDLPIIIVKDKVINGVNASRLKNNPVSISEYDIINILEEI